MAKGNGHPWLWFVVFATLGLVLAGYLGQRAASVLPASDAWSEIRYVSASALNLRAEPSTGAGIVRSLVQGTRLVVVAARDGWLKVQVEGTEGWVSAQYASLAKPTPKVTQQTTVPVHCPGRLTCKEIGSCREAQFYLANCSWGHRLDGDSDGIPCESIC